MRKPKKRNKDLTDAYRMEHIACELGPHLEGPRWEKLKREWLGFFHIRYLDDFPLDSLQLHHINQGCHRWDLVSNILILSPAAHAWCHEEPLHGRIACLWVKIQKGEFDRDLMRECLGFDVIGRMDSWEVTEEWVEEMRLDIYERLSAQ